MARRADGAGAPEYWRRLRTQKDAVMSVREAASRHQGTLSRLLERVAGVIAHPLFFTAEFFFHLGWLLLNSGLVTAVEPWDPYPFSLLLGMTSAQALFIALLILMHQRRDRWIAEVRDETELQVALHAEREASKLLRLMEDVHRTLGIRSPELDAELKEMEQPLDPERLRETMEDELESDGGS